MSTNAQLADLYAIGIPENAISRVPVEDRQAALDAAEATINGYVSARYPLPIITEDMGYKRAVCCLAGYDLITSRGYNPGSGADVNLRLRAEDAIRWAEQVSKGAISVVVLNAAPAGNMYDAPIVVTSPRQGW